MSRRLENGIAGFSGGEDRVIYDVNQGSSDLTLVLTPYRGGVVMPVKDNDSVTAILHYKGKFTTRNTVVKNVYPEDGLIYINFDATNTLLYGDAELIIEVQHTTDDGSAVLSTSISNNIGLKIEPNKSKLYPANPPYLISPLEPYIDDGTSRVHRQAAHGYIEYVGYFEGTEFEIQDVNNGMLFGITSTGEAISLPDDPDNGYYKNKVVFETVDGARYFTIKILPFN